MVFALNLDKVLLKKCFSSSGHNSKFVKACIEEEKNERINTFFRRLISRLPISVVKVYEKRAF